MDKFTPEDLWEEWRIKEIELLPLKIAKEDGLTSKNYKSLISPSLYSSFMRYVELVNKYPENNREDVAVRASLEVNGRY
jgi:hypothetical protein|tara:strand:+ start:560 stop:796 length:237 start_codon:yes stop_codon:yes gene_type:complete